MTLYNCLSGYDNTQKPWLSSYNVPFKNLLSGSSSEDDHNCACLYDDQKERLYNKSANPLAGTKVLLEIFSQFDENEYAAREKLESRINEKKKEIYQQGMRDKMGFLLYDYFSSLVEEEATAVETPADMEFILKNFANIQVIFLKSFKAVRHSGTSTGVNITLVEKGMEMELEKIFNRARALCFHYSSKEDGYLMDDFYFSTS